MSYISNLLRRHSYTAISSFYTMFILIIFFSLLQIMFVCQFFIPIGGRARCTNRNGERERARKKINRDNLFNVFGVVVVYSFSIAANNIYECWLPFCVIPINDIVLNINYIEENRMACMVFSVFVRCLNHLCVNKTVLDSRWTYKT